MRVPLKDEPVVRACETLMPIVRAANQLLKRKRISALALRGLDGWSTAHGNGWSALNVAILIATGSDAYAIVAKTSGTKRTPERLQALHKRWRASQLRA